MSRKVEFFDGASTGTVPETGNIDASSLNSYANDAAYEAANVGSPVAGNIYFNTSLLTVRYYSGSDWVDIINGADFDPDTKQDISEKGLADGYASLDSGGLVPSSQLPPNDVLSVNGEVGTVVLDTDDISEGITNEYYTDAKVESVISTASVGDLSDVDLSTPALDGQTLVWSDADSAFIPDDQSGGSGQGETNYSANPYFIEDTTGVSSSGGDLTFALTSVSGEAQFPSISENSLMVSKAAADCEDDFITLNSITLDPAYQKSGMAVVKLQVDTTVDSNFVNESFKIVVTDPNDSDREVNFGGDVLIQSNSSTEYQVLIDIPPTATELDTRVVCVSSSATAYDFIIGKHVVGELGQIEVSSEGEWENATVTGTWTTNTTYSAKKKKAKDSTHYQVLISLSGAPNSATLDITLDETIDTNKLSDNGSPIASQSLIPFSQTTILDSGTKKYTSSQLEYIDATTVRPSRDTGDGGRADITQAAPFTFANGDKIWMSFTIPTTDVRQGNTLTNFELGLQTNGAFSTAATPSGTLSAAFNRINFPSVYDNKYLSYDTSTGELTSNRDGFLTVSAFAEISHTSSAGAVALRIRNVTKSLSVGGEVPRVTRSQSNPVVVGRLPVSRNDTIQLESYCAPSGASFTNSLTGSGFSFKFDEDFTLYNAIASNEKIKLSSSGSISYSITAGQYGDLSSFIIPKNQEWDISIQGRINSGNTTSFNFGLGTSSGNSAFTTTEGEGWLAVDKLSTIARTAISLMYNHSPQSSDTTYYLKSFLSSTASTSIAWQIFARRIR